MSAGIILFAAFAVCLIVGVPVSISLGVASLCSVVFGGLSASSTVIAQRIFGGLQSTSIMAIAFFVLAGNLMTKGGISRRIVNFANCLVGNVRGGMSLALVLACAFFAALSGSAPATVIAIGTMLYNDMVKLGYPGDRTAGLLVVSGGLGPIIPPSIIMVIYCTLTGASVGNMFKQGMLIGIVIMLVLMTEVLFYAKKENWPKQAVKRSPSEIFKIFLDAIPALMTPIYHPWRYLLRYADSNRKCCHRSCMGCHCRTVHLQRTDCKRTGPHFKRFREKLCHDLIHHRSFYRFLLGIYLLRRFPGTGKRSYQHAFKFRAVLLRSCHYPADLRYIHGRNRDCRSFSTGPLAYCPEYGH